MNTAQRVGELHMRTLLLVLVMFSVSACASSMNELVAEASQSGDWRPVNKRIDNEEAARAEQQVCSSRHTLYCKTNLDKTSCACVSSEALWDRIGDPARRQRENRH
jgi:hypothetical protein